MNLADLAAALRQGSGLAGKAEIGLVTARLGLGGGDVAVGDVSVVDVQVGDDCAAIPDGDGYALLAIEGFIAGFVAADPWFAGWCGVMVNLSDIAAMGGRASAIVDAIWADGEAGAAPLLAGLRDAAAAYGVKIVGGHSNLHHGGGQLAVAVLGRARRLLSSFAAAPGQVLVAAIDLRGEMRVQFDHWDAATSAPAARLRGDLAILPDLAEAGLAAAGKDISQGGLIGTAAMFAECSGVGMTIDIRAVPRPAAVDVARWLGCFPSFGFLLSVAAADVAAVVAAFSGRGIAAAAIGQVHGGRRLGITDGVDEEMIWDFAARGLILPQAVPA